MQIVSVPDCTPGGARHLGATPPPPTMPPPLKTAAHALGFAAMAASLAGHVAVVFCLFRPWDEVAAVTVFPIWIWAALGIGVAVAGRLLTKSRLFWIPVFVWLLTVAIGADERRSLARGFSPTLHAWSKPPPPDGAAGTVLRIATINSKERNIDAVREVARFNPDVIFVQEAPAIGPLRTLATELWGESGSAAGAWHCAVLADGQLTTRPRASGMVQHGTGAMLTLADGREVELMSLHLEHATTRWDLWAPSCWREHRDKHRVRKTQLATLIGQLETTAAGRPAVFGGDFNAPPTSNLFDTVPASYQNAFGTAGKGLGNTFINGFPVLRIDHLYAGPGTRVLDARAARTEHSDHRMVIADVWIVSH